jgi:hypothetical protein
MEDRSPFGALLFLEGDEDRKIARPAKVLAHNGIAVRIQAGQKGEDGLLAPVLDLGIPDMIGQLRKGRWLLVADDPDLLGEAGLDQGPGHEGPRALARDAEKLLVASSP